MNKGKKLQLTDAERQRRSERMKYVRANLTPPIDAEQRVKIVISMMRTRYNKEVDHIQTPQERKIAMREADHRFKTANKELLKQRRAKHRQANLEMMRQRERVEAVGRRRRDPFAYAAWAFGLSLAEVYEMYDTQNHLCAICRQPERIATKGTLRRLAIDHDHETGVIRALLCSQCNQALGLFQDDPFLMRTAAAYLESHRENRIPSQAYFEGHA